MYAQVINKTDFSRKNITVCGSDTFLYYDKNKCLICQVQHHDSQSDPREKRYKLLQTWLEIQSNRTFVMSY